MSGTVDDIYQSSLRFGSWQHRSEIVAFASWVMSQELGSFLEIGTNHGGTFYVLSAVVPRSALKVSIDLPNPAAITNQQRLAMIGLISGERENVHFLEGDSHDCQLLGQIKALMNDSGVAFLDFMFIDGDHSYLGCKADYYMYRGLVRAGGYIGFHDVNETSRQKRRGCRVDQLWVELMGDKLEFNIHSSWGGIGVLKREVKHERPLSSAEQKLILDYRQEQL